MTAFLIFVIFVLTIALVAATLDARTQRFAAFDANEKVVDAQAMAGAAREHSKELGIQRAHLGREVRELRTERDHLRRMLQHQTYYSGPGLSGSG